jgi:hypothetical protein
MVIVDFFWKWGSHNLCIEKMYTALLYFIYSTKAGKSLRTIIQIEASKQRCQSTTKLVQFYINSQGLVPRLSPSRTPGDISSSKVHLHLSFRQPISKILDRSKALTRLSIDSTTMPDGAPALRESILAHLTPRPHCAMLPELSVVDAEDKHHSTSYHHHPAAVPKTMTPRGRATQSVKIVRSGRPRSRVSPGAAQIGRGKAAPTMPSTRETVLGHRHCLQ